ncbi:MAG: DNA glycosylase [Actinomycetales bacterium]|nr:DNA glycosylase [Actinomycetales bacterium]
MPEGDTVHRTARLQHAALAGRTLTAAELRVPRFATAELAGLRVDEVVARGKHLLHRLGPYTLHSHLKMEGSWRSFAALDPSAGAAGGFERWSRPGYLARAILTTDAVQAVGFELGTLELLERADEERAVGHLGPDLLDPEWGEGLRAEAIRRLEAEPEVPVFVAVLDQRKLAGVGNVYANELAFLRGVLPTHPIGETDVPALVDLARRMLLANVDRWTRSTTGDLRPGERSWVYGRRGRRCRRCGTPLRSGELGPAVAPTEPDRDRVVTWCPRCQS